MSSFYEPEENPNAHELAQRAKKQQQIDNSAGGWRDNVIRGYNPDDVFKTLSNVSKTKRATK